MPLPERQTVGLLIGHTLLGVLGVLAVSKFGFGTELTPRIIAEKLLFVEFMVVITTATTYSRLPEPRRLPPVHALGLGCLHLCVMAWMVLIGPVEVPPRWVTVVAFGVSAVPGVYLIAKAVRQLRRSTFGDTTNPNDV
ncbi:MAG: hypothetical protein SFU84_00185 [Gemmatimonadales bacterium]|nr:hypothetical protein [Gemmatimonadales bacterium]